MALAAAASWGFSAVAAKDIFGAVPPVRLAQLRSASAVILVMGALAIIDRTALRLTRSAVPGVLAFGVCLAVVNGTYYLAIRRLPVGVALTIQYLGPLGVIALRRRRATRWLWGAAVVCLIGSALVAGVLGGVRGSATGILLAFGSAVSFAGYLIAGEAVGARIGSAAAVAWGFLVATVIWALVLPWWSFPFGALTRPSVPLRVAVVCLPGTVIPFLLMVAALRRISAGPAGVLATAEPGFGALFAWLLLGEHLGAAQVVGLALVVVGVAVVQARAAPAVIPPD